MILSFRAQGAAEYLVLLAAVLIIALVSIAVLNFFPGEASEAMIAESEAYWKSAYPIAITEMSAKPNPTYAEITFVYIRITNIGDRPIRITKVLGNGDSAREVVIGWNPDNSSIVANISDYFYMQPGETKFFGRRDRWIGLSNDPAQGYRIITFGPWGGGLNSDLPSPSSRCSLTGTGVASMKNFGFEYIVYVEGQQVTKTQVGSVPLIMRCEPWCAWNAVAGTCT